MQTQLSDYVEIEGKKLYYEVAGEGTPLVFAHAGFLDSGMWDSQWEAFRRHYQVIRYDMRGYGQSEPPQGPTSRRAELSALLDHLAIDSAYLVGCSMGGELMLDFVIEHPEKVKGLVMVNSTASGFEFQGEPPANMLALMEAIQQRDVPLISELQLRLWIDGPYRKPEEVDPNVRQRAAGMNQISVRNFTWVVADMQPSNPLTPPASQRLGSVHVPTLVVVGALDDPEIHRAADILTSGIQGSQKVVIADAAHIPSMEKPAEFNQILSEFLQSISSNR